VNCAVWWLDPGPAVEPYLGLLDDVERDRMGALLRVEDRVRFAAAAALLRTVAGEATGTPPPAVRVDRACPDCARPHGRPTLPGTGLHASVSHSGARVVVALTAHGPVGVDVEQARAIDHDGMAGHVLGPDERAGDLTAFYRYWTRKESAVKATGDGLRVPLDQVRVSPPDQPARLLAYPGRPDLVATMADLAPGDGYLGAVTILAPGPVEVREHRVSRL